MPLDIIPPEIIDTQITTLDRLLEVLIDNAVNFGIKLVAAAVVFTIGRWLIRWLRKFITRFLEKRKIESTVKSFLDSLVNISLQIVLFLIIVNILGISTTSFAAILAAAGLAIGMAMKDNLSNFAGGVLLLINKPFRVGDRILAQGMDGTVQSIGILYTIMLTGDNRTIYIPNGPLSTGTIINYSNQQQRRIDITLAIGYGVDMEKVKSLLQTIIKDNGLIKDYPAPFVGLTAVNNGSLDVTVRAWVNSADFSSVNIDLNEKIYAVFSENGIYTPAALSIKMLKD